MPTDVPFMVMKTDQMSNPWWWNNWNAHGCLIHGGENLDQMPIDVWSMVVINSNAHKYPNLWWW